MQDRVEQNLTVGLLLDFYGELLGDRQRDIITCYVCDDLSLSEIAENFGITRQGVRDSIRKSEEALLRYEECLGLYAKSKRDEETLTKAQALLASLSPSEKDCAIREELSALLTALLS